MNYYNFGSNWGGSATGVNILDLFFKYGIVFAGLDDNNDDEKNWRAKAIERVNNGKKI